jgi:hypothetical protein
MLLREQIDMACDTGEIMWGEIREGECVLLELPSRWYLGVVVARGAMTARLFPALCGHELGDMGLFLEGSPSGHEITPLARGVEVNLNSIDTAQAYPYAFFERINRRSHTPAGRS